MIADTRASKIAIQTQAMKDIKKGVHSDNKKIESKSANNKSQPKIENKTKIVNESLPLKHQSKTIDNNPKNKSKLDLYTQKGSEDTNSKNNINKSKGITSKNMFTSKLDQFSKEEFEKQEVKNIEENLERNFSKLNFSSSNNENNSFKKSTMSEEYINQDRDFKVLGKNRFINNNELFDSKISIENNSEQNSSKLNDNNSRSLFNRKDDQQNNNSNTINKKYEEDLIDFDTVTN